GGVSFTKGCYPGQEVVARSHYRGKQKRRVLLGRLVPPAADANALLGTDVFDANTTGEPIGRIVSAANSPGSTHVLFEAPFASAGSADLRVGDSSGPALALGELPYPLEQET